MHCMGCCNVAPSCPPPLEHVGPLPLQLPNFSNCCLCPNLKGNHGMSWSMGSKPEHPSSEQTHHCVSKDLCISGCQTATTASPLCAAL